MLGLMNNSRETSEMETDKFLDILLLHPNHDVAAIVVNHSHSDVITIKLANVCQFFIGFAKKYQCAHYCKFHCIFMEKRMPMHVSCLG